MPVVGWIFRWTAQEGSKGLRNQGIQVVDEARE
jgi:hypothetical protein